MYVPVLPGLAVELQRRGVPIAPALRAEYLNRNITPANFKASVKELEKTMTTYGQQAAALIESAFDFNDTREGPTYWKELCSKLKVVL